MSDISPYGTTEHVGKDGPLTADALAGSRAGSTNVNAIGDVGPAMFSTAPYVPPVKPGRYGCRGKDGACKAPAINGTDYCFFHSQDYR